MVLVTVQGFPWTHLQIIAKWNLDCKCSEPIQPLSKWNYYSETSKVGKIRPLHGVPLEHDLKRKLGTVLIGGRVF